MREKFIKVSYQHEGIHRFPEAATNPELADVQFLAHPHRHIFWFYVTTSVSHDNREIEFIQQKRWLESMFKENVINIDYKSCEMLAEMVLNKLIDKYGDFRYYKVEVYEDNENGGIVEYYPEN
jgi:hypothetical protein